MSVKIVLDAKGKQEIAKAFGITIANVGMALLYKRNSKNSERIREMALQLGGKMIEEREIEVPKKVVKMLDSRGNVKASRSV